MGCVGAAEAGAAALMERVGAKDADGGAARFCRFCGAPIVPVAHEDALMMAQLVRRFVVCCFVECCFVVCAPTNCSCLRGSSRIVFRWVPV